VVARYFILVNNAEMNAYRKHAQRVYWRRASFSPTERANSYKHSVPRIYMAGSTAFLEKNEVFGCRERAPWI